ncbi:RNA polymerase subunit sigma-24 [Pelomonas sp. Root1217]|uniref:RNA polymerase sigma factor n=1 Tax=Pelomonas sp. Root1217 TaxID=1736430 RepID=UPI00070DC537|nr:RNA polymerase sigma factor [Pelomonas sp. Root1217]KQV46956.1 RNA polymerase subunit sigma-24 [Pelomonas sp. Root1217]
MSIDWQRVFSKVKSALMRRGRSEHDADDLVQEAWIRLACYERDNTVEQPEAFLMRAAINLSIDAHRLSATRGEQVTLEDLVLIDGRPGVEDELLGRERLARLSECISLLSGQTRQILLAHRIDGLSYQEIARRHGISITTVHKHIAKAVLLIAGRMEGWYP